MNQQMNLETNALKIAWIISFFINCVESVVAYTKPQQGQKEESERLRGEGDQVEFYWC